MLSVGGEGWHGIPERPAATDRLHGIDRLVSCDLVRHARRTRARAPESLDRLGGLHRRTQNRATSMLASSAIRRSHRHSTWLPRRRRAWRGEHRRACCRRLRICWTWFASDYWQGERRLAAGPRTFGASETRAPGRNRPHSAWPCCAMQVRYWWICIVPQVISR